MKIVTKPDVKKSVEPHTVATSDNFDNGIGKHWQFNHNPDMSRISAEDGTLSISPAQASTLRNARNMLTQKLMGYTGEITVKVDISKLAENSFAGLVCLGNKTFGICVRNIYGSKIIGTETNGSHKVVTSANDVAWLRLTYDAHTSTIQPWYSSDGINFKKTSESIEIGDGDWKGVHIGLYTYTKNAPIDDSVAVFDDFIYTTDHISHQ